ncbi:MAG: ClbS/DfsB family four-helix bundle protein [Saprospiraceae bacterium]
MAIPHDKISLQTAMEDRYAKLSQEFIDIPERFIRLQNLPGHAKGTQMSIANLLAYLIGWGALVLKWHYRDQAEMPIDFPETGFQWNELGKLAQKFYRDYEELDYAALQAQLEENHQQLLQLVQTTPNEELYGKAWYKKYPLGRMIQLNTAAPYKNARSRIRKWKKLHS